SSAWSVIPSSDTRRTPALVVRLPRELTRRIPRRRLTARDTRSAHHTDDRGDLIRQLPGLAHHETRIRSEEAGHPALRTMFRRIVFPVVEWTTGVRGTGVRDQLEVVVLGGRRELDRLWQRRRRFLRRQTTGHFIL